MLDEVKRVSSLEMLNSELKYHPILQARLNELLELNNGNISFELKFGEIAAYCEIKLDGVFQPKEVESLAEKMYWILRSSRI